MMEGLGYGIVVYRGDPLIEHNYFDGNRHSIAGSGQSVCSYDARYNLQGPNGLNFGFEIHHPGGDRINIHPNTFELVENRSENTTVAVAIRSTPSSGACMADNWFFNSTDPGDDRFADDSPVIEYYTDAGGSGWNRVSLSCTTLGARNRPPTPVTPARRTTTGTCSRSRAGGRRLTTSFRSRTRLRNPPSTGTINDYDSVNGSRVTGWTTHESGPFVFTGEVTDFEVSASVDVTIDGEPRSLIRPLSFRTVEV